MDWTVRQQAILLIRSGGLGFLLGIIFGGMSAVGRLYSRRRVFRFGFDAFFGVVAAFCTFFYALAVMDGRFHPLLFIGAGIGFVAERRSCARWCGEWLYRSLLGFRRGVQKCVRRIEEKKRILICSIENKFLPDTVSWIKKRKKYSKQSKKISKTS